MPAGPEFGAQFHGAWDYANEEEREEALGLLRDAGATWVRIDMGWAGVEPAEGEYDRRDLSRYDHAIADAHEIGFDVLLTILDTPRWATHSTDDSAVPPDDPETYARFVHDMAKRYRGQVSAVELWNEPNNDEFFYSKDNGEEAEEFTELVRSAYRAVKSTEDVTVIAGGAQYVDDDWWSDLYAHGIADYTDVVAVNPYMGDRPPTLEDDGSIYRINHLSALLDIMRANGDADKPVWFTEFGWSTYHGEGGVTEEQQAAYLRETVNLLHSRYPQVGTVFWYTLRDRAHSTVTNNNYGLLRRDFSPKPAFEELAAIYGIG